MNIFTYDKIKFACLTLTASAISLDWGSNDHLNASEPLVSSSQNSQIDQTNISEKENTHRSSVDANSKIYDPTNVSETPVDTLDLDVHDAKRLHENPFSFQPNQRTTKF